MLKITKAEALRYHEIFKRMLAELTDEDALQVPLLYKQWKPNIEYVADERIQHEGILYKVLQAHTSQETWTPDISPSLFARVLIPNPDVVPEWVQPDSTNPYMKDDKVTHNGQTWISEVDNNVWEPGVYGWNAIE